MATATITRPTPAAPRPATGAAATRSEATVGQKAVTALVIGAASAVTLGIFAWATWVASQIAIPV